MGPGLAGLGSAPLWPLSVREAPHPISRRRPHLPFGQGSRRSQWRLVRPFKQSPGPMGRAGDGSLHENRPGKERSTAPVCCQAPSLPASLHPGSLSALSPWPSANGPSSPSPALLPRGPRLTPAPCPAGAGHPQTCGAGCTRHQGPSLPSPPSSSGKGDFKPAAGTPLDLPPGLTACLRHAPLSQGWWLPPKPFSPLLPSHRPGLEDPREDLRWVPQGLCKAPDTPCKSPSGWGEQGEAVPPAPSVPSLEAEMSVALATGTPAPTLSR